jgi:hypothetical protein
MTGFTGTVIGVTQAVSYDFDANCVAIVAGRRTERTLGYPAKICRKF